MLSADGFGVGAGASGFDGGARLEINLAADELSGGMTTLIDGGGADDFGDSDTPIAMAAETIEATWTAAEGGEWSDAGNWRDGHVPVAGDDVLITGIGAGETVIFTGDTPVLGSLSIEAGTVQIAGGLTTGTLSIAGGATLELSGFGTSSISGNVAIESGATVIVTDSALVIWTAGDEGEWAQRGQFTLASGTEFRVTDAGHVNLLDGVLQIDSGAELTLTDTWGNLFVDGGELRVNGAVHVSGDSTEILVHAGGLLTGSGSVSSSSLIVVNGTIGPGAGDGGTGSLRIDSDVVFRETWAVHLDVLNGETDSSSSFDILSITGTVTFEGTGAITLDASEVDFGDLADGSALGDVNGLFHAGDSAGSATVHVIAGDVDTVMGTWNATDHRLDVTMVNNVEDVSGATVVDGLATTTTALQGMLGGFNLGTINFASQSRTSFTVPTLPSVLADLFDLSALSANVALPSIGNPDGLAATITALEGAGYTVDTSVAGAEFVATFTRTVATDRPVAGGYLGATFAGAADFLSGLADDVDLDAALNLLASLVQHVVFELRDGVFNFLSDSYLALTIVGGASLTGTVRQGGRTVTATGSTSVDTTVRVWHATGGTTATGSGTATISLSLAADPATLSYGFTRTLGFDAGTLMTTSNSTATLGGTLTLDGVTDSAGDPAELALTGTLTGTGDSWTLSGSGSDVQWLSFAVNSWDFTLSASDGVFSGSGTIDADLDFLADSLGSAPEVTLNATFDQDEISFNGTLATDLIAVTNPAGGTYLSISDFSSSLAVTGDLDTGAWTGSLTFSGGDSTLGPDGAAFTASITDGDDEDSVAVEGSYDFSTQAFSTSVDQFEMVAENIVRLTAAGVTLRHQRDVTDEQELLAADNVTLELLFLTSAPSTGPPTAEAADLSIRTNGISIGAGSLTLDEIEIGSALSLSGVTLSFNAFSFLDGAVTSDSVTLAADAATLFPDGGVFSAAATNLSGTYDFSADDDRIGLSADTLIFGIDGLVDFNAADIVIRPEGDIVFSAETMAATLIPFDLSGEIDGLQIASDGTPSAVSFTVDTGGLAESLQLGGLLPLEITGIDVAFLGDANGNGTRDDGEVFRLDSFDLTIAGTFDFSVLSGLPFTPIIQVGDETFADGTDAFAVTLRSVAGTFQIWETESITIGVADLQIGNLFEIAGSITLGGYTAGEWVGGFDGNLVITSLNDNVTASATATVSGAVDVAAGTVAVETEATLDLGIGTTITLSEAALSTDFTIAKEETGNLTFAINMASASVGTLSVGSIFAATDVTASLSDLSISGAGVTLGSISFGAASATVLPENGLGITATTTGFGGSYDFTTDPDTFVLTAETLTFALADVVTFNATGVSITPNDDVIFSVATVSANLPGMGVSGEVTGFQLAANGTPSATSVLLDTSSLADSLGLGGVLPFNVDAIALTAPSDGGRVAFDNFDLTVAGTIDFSGLDGLPFTPTITIDGQTSRGDDETATEFSFTVRIDDGNIQIWDTPTITLGVENLQIGSVIEISGSVTLGGYTDGVWGGDFGGALSVTSLNENVTASASATVSGSVDVATKRVTVNTAATLNLGLADTITLNDAALTLNFTLTDTVDSGLVLAVSEASASVATLKVGTIFEASAVTATFTDLTVSGNGVALGAISFSAGSATLLPEMDSITATTTDFSGRYDFTTDPDTFELTAATVHFALAGVVSLEATGVSLTPMNETVFAVAAVSATLDGFDSSAAVTDFALARDGTPTAGGIAINTEGLADSIGLGGVLPFNIAGIEIAAPEAGGRISFGDFDLTVSGTFDFGALEALPFTPVIRIGAQEADDGADSFTFTMRMEDGALTPWNLGPIELGVTDLNLGDALTFGGTIRLGGYAEGVWVSSVGGTLTLGATSTTNNLSGEVTVSIDGSWTEATGVLDLSASFTVSFELGDYVEVTDANIGLMLTLGTRGADDTFELSVTQFTVEKASIASVAVNFGSVLSMAATDATFDFAATGSAELLSVGSLQATLTGLGIGGEARNFAIAADGSLRLGDEFGVSLQLGDGGTSTIKWPSWIPLQVTLFDIQWRNLSEDPLDFTLRVSGSVSTEGLSGSKLTLAGSVSNLIIDVGLLKAGAFPIIGLGDVGIAVGGKIAGSKLSAALLLGVLRVDADGNVIGDADTTTEVAQRVLWGAVQGAIDIAGYGGFEIYLGVSQYGPLQGFVKASAPVPIDVTGVTGLALTGFRGGITFNSELPAITDPKALADSPEFKPTATLSFTEWRTLMLNSLATQVGSATDGGLLAILQNPFRVEGGVTVFSLYASKAAFNVDGDFIMDSTGKFLVRGAFEVGGTISFTANLYVDISRFVTEGNATILFFAELPSEFPMATLYGSLIFDFGVTIDPENPPAAEFVQFTVKITGGIELGIEGLPSVVIEGEANLEVATDAPSLHLTLSGRASIEMVGDLVGVAGDVKLFFGEDDTVQAVGIIALTPADMAQLQAVGLEIDGVAVLRFNTTADAVDYTLNIPGQTEPQTFTVAAGEASLLVRGKVNFTPAGTELFRLDGLLSLRWAADGFDAVVDAHLLAGPTAAPLLRFDAQGYLKLVVEGIHVGMAAKLDLVLDAGDNPLAEAGVNLSGTYAFLMNTTGEDVDYALPTVLAGESPVDRIYLPRGPPAADGSPSGSAGSYLIVRAAGSLTVLDQITLSGTFDFTVTNGVLDLTYDATLTLAVGDVTFYSFTTSGQFRIDAAGLYGSAQLELSLSDSAATSGLGFSLEATWTLQLNTTGAAQTLGTMTLAEGSYARVRADGQLVVGELVLSGLYDFSVESEGVALAATGTVELGVGGVTFYSFGFAGGLLIQADGIFSELTLSVESSGRDTYGFGFGAAASYTLSLNTTAEEIDGVPAGLGGRVQVEGALEIGDWKLDGVYTLTASTTGIGFAASAAMVLRAGEDELLRVPLAFEIELTIPGIVEEISLELDPATLSGNVPGLALSGAAKLVINTTAQTHGDIPAGPMLQLVIEGSAVIGGLALDGRFGFESTLSSTTMVSDFSVNFGLSEAPLLVFAGSGAFELSLGGVAGYVEMSRTGGDPAYGDFFGSDVNFFLEANTRSVPYQLGERELPAGPFLNLGAEGTVTVADLDLVGTFNFAANGDAIDLTVDAAAQINLPILGGGELTLLSMTVQGGMHLDAEGLVAALEVTPQTFDFESVGLSLDAGANFSLRINTTGAAQTVGEIELEAGKYARVAFDATLTVGVFSLEGHYSLAVEGNTAELLLQTDLVVALPAIGSTPGLELLRMHATGAARIDATGVVAAVALDRGALDQLAIGGITLPFGASQTFALQLNTTGAAQTLGPLTLEAGRYARIATEGEIDLGLGRISGLYQLKAGERGVELALDADLVVGIPLTAITLFRWHLQGGLSVTAAGVAGAVHLDAPIGLAGLQSIGLKIKTIGQDAARRLEINTTGETQVVGGVALSAGNYIEVAFADSLSVGLASTGGTNILRLGADGLRWRTLGELEMGVPGVVTLFKMEANHEWHITSDGVFGRAALTQSREPITIAGVALTPDFSAGSVLSINTTGEERMVDGQLIGARTISLGLHASLTLLGQTISGETLLVADIANGRAVLWQSGTVSLGIGDWRPFTFDAEGYTVISADGVAMDYRLALQGGAGVPGVSFDGEWSMSASTLSAPMTIAAFDAGGLSVPEIRAETGWYFRTRLAGSVTVGGLALNGTFELDAGSVEFAMTADASVSLFDVSANVNGRMYLHPTRGFVANLGLEWGGIDNALMRLSGSAHLRINTWDGVWEGVAANTVEVGLDNVTLSLGGFNLTGSAAFSWQDGVATFRATDLAVSLIPGLTARASGAMTSDGEFDFTLSGETDGPFGIGGLFSLTGSFTGTFNNAGITGSWSGRFDWPNDYSTFSGSFAISASRMVLDLVLPRTKLLGIGILSGHVTVTAENNTLTLTAAQAAPLKLEVTGDLFNASVWGTISTDGTIDFNGTANLNVGDANFVKISGALDVRVTNRGFSANLNGRIDLLGVDYATVSGSVVAEDGDLAMSLDMGRVKLLGDALIISGRIEAYMEDGRVGFNVAESNPLKLEVLGGAIEASVWGYIWSDGVINLNGTASLDLGSQSTLRVRGDLAVHVGNDGFSADLSGRIDLFNLDWTSVEGSMAIQGGELAMSLAMNRVKLLGSALIVSGQIDLNRGADGRMVLSAAQSSPLRIELAGGIAELTGWGTISTDGVVDISATGRLDIGSTSALAVVGDLDLDISRTRIAGSLNSHLWIAGDTTNTTRSSVSLDLQSGRFSFSTDGRVRVLGVTLSTSMSVTVGPDGVAGSLSANATIFGNYYNFSGSFSTSGSWSFVGRSSGWVGVKHIADARYYSYFEFNDRGGSFAIWGTLWVFGSAHEFSADVNLTNRTASFSASRGEGDDRVSIWGTLYFDSGIVTLWASELENATVFFDANLNGVRDEGEPIGVQLEDGSYDFGNTEPESDAVVSSDKDVLGLLAPYDTNGDNRITDDELAIYAVNGITDDDGVAPVRFYLDANGDGTYNDGELSADLPSTTIGEFYQNPNVVPDGMEEFDTNANGRLDGSELNGLRTLNLGSRVPLTRLTAGVSGTVTVDDADFVFADVNGNGLYDAGEPRVTPTSDGRYFFRSLDDADLTNDNEVRHLGRLAPFDTNGNGVIDPNEGEFVVTGGTDADSGVDGTLVMRAPAGGFGGSDAQAISPLSTLMASMVEQGLTEADAADLIEDAFDLPAGIELTSYNPVELDAQTDHAAESASLSSGAKVMAIVTGGASLLGDDSDADLQDAMVDALASTLIAGQATGGGDYSVELSDAGLIGSVLIDAGARTGREMGAEVAAAVAQVLVNATNDISAAAQTGSDVSRALAAHKAVILTTVNSAIEQIAAGNLTIDELLDQLSDDQINTFLEAVDLLPSIGPSLPPLYDLETRGGESFELPLTVEDPDSRLSDLHFMAVSSNQQVVADEDLHFEYVQGRWQLSITTGALSSGSSMITLSVSDGWETYYNEFEIVLDGMNPAVRLETALPDQRLVAGQSVLIDLDDHFVDQNNDVTYTVTALGTNAVVDAQIVGGQLQMTARNDLSGLGVFELVATDADTTIVERFAVITYPTVAVSEAVRYTRTGEVEIDVTLSNPATQSLSLRYSLASNDPAQEALTGLLRFAAGETSATLVINLAESGIDDSSVSLDVQGAWTTGDFIVSLHNRDPGQLLDLQHRVGLCLEFTLIYDVVADAEEEEAVLLVGMVPVANVLHTSTFTEGGMRADDAATGAGSTSLLAATSLEATELPRALRGI